MDICRETIELVVHCLKKLQENYTSELEKSPAGSLIRNNNRGVPRFYHAYHEDKRYVRKYLSLADSNGSSLIRTLARKEFLLRALPLLEANIRELERALSLYVSVDPASIISGMKRAYKHLENSFFFTYGNTSVNGEMLKLLTAQSDLGSCFNEDDEQRILRMQDHFEWASQPYLKNDYPFGDDIILASNGERVRSRGEVVIYEKLKELIVPFRYDMKKWFGETPEDGYWLSPDFTFEDRSYNELYLEYNGMMDDPEYVRRFLIKRQQYEKAGIVPWKNIIFIYGTGNNFDVGLIESVIRHQIIPRL